MSSLSSGIRALFRRIIWILCRAVGLRLVRAVPRLAGEVQKGRLGYQQLFADFKMEAGWRVLDVGSGPNPFPFATVLSDRYACDTRHRHKPLLRDDRPMIVADVCCLPFFDKAFDYVYCSHVLEHVENPIEACRELVRVGKRGYIETPTFGKDCLFAQRNLPHKWYVTQIADLLCFFEYSQRQSKGIGSKAWRKIIKGKWYHPMQDAYWHNIDVFNVMFEWDGSFRALAFRLDGTLDSFGVDLREKGVDARRA